MIGKRNRPILHPRFFDNQRQIYIERCTIQESIESQLDNGEVVNQWVDVDGLISVPCVLSNLAGLGTPQQEETRLSDHTNVTENRHVSFTDLHLGIEQGMRAVVDRLGFNTNNVLQSLIFDIMGIDHSSQSEVTRIRVEIVSA